MAKAIRLKYNEAASDKEVHFDLRLQGFTVGESVTLEIWEVDESGEYKKHGETKIGTLKGTIKADTGADQILSGAAGTDLTTGSPRFSLITEGTTSFGFSPVSPGEQDEADSWEIQLRVAGDAAVKSPVWYLARYSRQVPSTQATYRWHDGNDVSFYNDASTDSTGSGGYFHDLNRAIDDAHHFIFISDWSFHPYMRIQPGGTETIGEKLVKWAKAHPDGLVSIHVWDHTDIAASDPQNDDGEKIFKSEMVKPSNMQWRMSSRTGEDGAAGFGWSHHQKFVVLDCACPGDDKGRRTIRAFIGGLDLTKGRFDWPGHPYLPEDPLADRFRKVTHKPRKVHDWYNGEFGDAPLDSGDNNVVRDNNKTFPRQAWHDIHGQLTGPTAWDVVREYVGRWNLDPAWAPNDAGGDTDSAAIKKAQKLFTDVLFDKTKFVQQWDGKPATGIWKAQILRSITKDHWGSKTTIKTPAKHDKTKEFDWTIKSTVKERSIQDAYLRAIGQAEKFVYIETQYFISSGSQWLHSKRSGVKNELAKALSDRILQKAAVKEPFHVFIILPMFPEGDPSSFSIQAQRDFQWETVAYMIRRLQKDSSVSSWKDYLTVGFLANWASLGGALNTSGKRLEQVQRNRRYMIYVHSKLMIVDDRYVILGSANLNERSLAGGRDSEICMAVWPTITKQEEGGKQIREFRRRLWSEHFGSPPSGWETPESGAHVAAVRKIGNDNWDLLHLGKHAVPGKSKHGHFCRWPFNGAKNTLDFRDKEAKLILDGLTGFITGDDWYIWPTGYTGTGDLAE